MRARLIASALATVLLSSAMVIFFPTTPVHAQGDNCDPSYPDVCIAPYPPDLNCGDIPYKDITVLPPDPHGLDGNDNDGIGCES
jgi:hypothetical protein